MKNLFSMFLSVMILIFCCFFTVSASLPLPLSYSSRAEFYNSVVDAKNELETNTVKTTGVLERENDLYDEKIEEITSYIDFKNIVKEVDLCEMRVRPVYITLDYRVKDGKKNKETDCLLIKTFRWNDFDENVYLNRAHSNNSRSVDSKINGKTVIKSKVYRNNEYICNTYYWVENGYAMFSSVPVWLLELYPEETFFDVQVVNLVTVKLNGTYLNFDQPPIMENDRTLVPLRAIFEALGAEVEWENDTQTVTAVKGETTISLQIGDTTVNVNGLNKTMDVPACLINGRTLVPLRFLSESLGYTVEWDEETLTATIHTEDMAAIA